MVRCIQLTIILLLQCFLISFGVFAAEEPVEGENFIWVDLGEESDGVLLTQSEQDDGITEPAEKNNVDCLENPWPYNGPGNNHMYFKIDDSFLFGGNHKAWIVMEYFDSNEAEQINCQYDSNGAGPVGGAFRGAGDGVRPPPRSHVQGHAPRAAAGRDGPELRRSGRTGRAARHRRMRAGIGGDQADPGSGRLADRAPHSLRRTGDELPRVQVASRPVQ